MSIANLSMNPLEVSRAFTWRIPGNRLYTFTRFIKRAVGLSPLEVRKKEGM